MGLSCKMKVKNITPRIENTVTYHKLELEPETHKSIDRCNLVFYEDYILISVSVDSCGNAFKLKYSDLEKCVR